MDWYPWGREALERARSEDRPILLSVGYSSCHWCHVMERESFEDATIAAAMNERFVNVKVDREERPDVDQVYMRAVQAMTGRGGWPMTVFLTPDGTPFYGGTYFPPEPRPGMPSFPQVLDAVHDAWTNRRDEVEAGGGRLLDALSAVDGADATRRAAPRLLEGTARALAARYDPTHGGFGGAPKFPQPVTLEFLLRWHVRSGERAPLDMVLHTLRRMAAGGMRDHLAGGFHRYSVDARWLVPHFEKMLYDNALLASVLLDAWRLTGAPDLRHLLEETLDWMAKEMRGPDDGFHAALDADSEGEEGLFYVWTPEEVDELLGPDARLFRRVYDVSEAGNFEGRSILHLLHPPASVAATEGMDEDALHAILERARATLLERRSERERPFLDEKVIVAWNGLAIRAFAEAGATLGRTDWLEVASDAADFLLSHLRLDGRLLHSWIDGAPSASDGVPIPALLDDTAALGNALLSLHAATLEPRWLDEALTVTEDVLERFWDDAAATVYDTAHDAEALVVRPRDSTDGATPSGPSLAAELLARAGHLSDSDRFRGVARKVVDREAEGLERFGAAFGRMLSVLDRLEADPVEVVVAGGDDDETRALVRAAHAVFLPGGVATGRLDDRPVPDLPVLRGRLRGDGDPRAWVCVGYTCRLPVNEPTDVVEEIRTAGGAPSSR